MFMVAKKCGDIEVHDGANLQPELALTCIPLRLIDVGKCPIQTVAHQ